MPHIKSMQEGVAKRSFEETQEVVADNRNRARRLPNCTKLPPRAPSSALFKHYNGRYVKTHLVHDCSEAVSQSKPHLKLLQRRSTLGSIRTISTAFHRWPSFSIHLARQRCLPPCTLRGIVSTLLSTALIEVSASTFLSTVLIEVFCEIGELVAA